MDLLEYSCPEQLPAASEWVIKKAGKNKIIAFYGEMGSGKTTLIKEICKQLGCTSGVTSPSFAIINEYPLGTNNFIFHFDFYRLQKARELLDIGFEEYLFSGNFCFIEWPEISESLLPPNTLKIRIKYLSGSNRLLSVIV